MDLQAILFILHSFFLFLAQLVCFILSACSSGIQGPADTLRPKSCAKVTMIGIFSWDSCVFMNLAGPDGHQLPC